MIRPEVPPGLDGGAGVIGIGIDVIEVERMSAALERTPSFASRVFTAAERAACERRADPAASFAARFAAKEAAFKVLGAGIFEVPLHDVELCGGVDVAPWLEVHGRAAERAAAAGIGRWLVSLTHDAGVAAAVVVGLHAGGAPGPRS